MSIPSTSRPPLTPAADASGRLIDGVYRVQSETALDEVRTVITAKDNHGTWLTITWYDLTLEQETAFEHYRVLLKSLKRKGLAAVHDVVSRPGAHYVVWAQANPATSQQAGKSADQLAIADMLDAHGRTLDDAILRRDHRDGRTYVYGLAWQPNASIDSGVIARVPWYRRLAKTSQQQRTWLLGLGLSVAGLGLMVAAVRTHAAWVVVPEVRGMMVNDAATLLYEHGLQATLDAVPSPLAAGEVIDVRPSVGYQLRAGRDVTLRYALPAAQMTPQNVPELRGLTIEEAANRLQAVGLELGRRLDIHATIQAGTVIAQANPAQASLPQGSEIDVLISLGPAPAMTVLPDVRGLSEADARAIALAASITTPLVIDYQQASRAAGTVLEQNHKPFVPFQTDATVRLVVASSASRAIADDGFANFIGMSERQARALARTQGVNPSFEAVSRPGLPEGVIMQSPAPNSNSTSNSVALTLNVQPVAVPRPDVRAEVLLTPSEPRTFRYRWDIDTDIAPQIAEVRAELVNGETLLLSRAMVAGGEVIEGTWTSDMRGPVTFRLTLNGFAYGEPLRRNP
jgi:beta-lactam-binding protein with PASTA domain